MEKNGGTIRYGLLVVLIFGLSTAFVVKIRSKASQEEFDRVAAVNKERLDTMNGTIEKLHKAAAATTRLETRVENVYDLLRARARRDKKAASAKKSPPVATKGGE
jgi:hypothetical protein